MSEFDAKQQLAGLLDWMRAQMKVCGGKTAVIEALRLLKEPCIVELYSDSRYVIDALEKRWVYGWKQRGWVKSDKKPALNVDLWEQLLDLIAQHELHYHWVKGHAENEYNNRCDEMAVAEWHKFK